MFETLEMILTGAIERLHATVTAYLPAVLAAMTLILSAWLIAAFARWLLYRIVKGMAMDRFLRRSGLAFMLDGSGRLRATKVVAESVYWCVLLTGVLMGINVFNTDQAECVRRKVSVLVERDDKLIILFRVRIGHRLNFRNLNIRDALAAL